MPELRTRPRINRLTDNAPPVAGGKRTVAATAAQTRRNRRQKKKKKNTIVAEKIENIVNNDDEGVERLKEEEAESKEKAVVRVSREEAMDEYDSGGRSADKALGAEEEGSTTPLPEKVMLILEKCL